MELWNQTIPITLEHLGLTLTFRLPLAQERMKALALRADLLTQKAKVQEGLPNEDEFASWGETEKRMHGMEFQAKLDSINAAHGVKILDQLRPLALEGCDDLDALFASDLLCEEAESIWTRIYFRSELRAGSVDAGSSGPEARPGPESDGGQAVQGLPDDVPSENLA